MKDSFQKQFSTDISKSLFTTLKHYFPPKDFNEALIDIVNILTDGLARGDVYIDIKESPINVDLKHKGWPDSHMQALLASGWTKGEKSPIVLNGEVISWRRAHNEITSTIQKVLLRNKPVNRTSKEFKLRGNSKNLDLLNSQQKKAVNLVESENIILLSGGPGTGKTSTIRQMLLRALMLNPNLNIAIAAPTGKAAKRLKDTIQEGITNIADPLEKKLSIIPCKTLHKWLEAGPNGFRRDSKRLLKLDLIVVDEMSMVDLSIMNGLVDSLPQSCQIILVGDPNQLLPIGSGAIWQLLQSKEMNKKFLSNSVQLTKSYRNQGDIALLRNTLKSDGLDAFWHLLSITKDSSSISQYISSLKKIPDPITNILFKYKKQLKVLTAKSIDYIPKESWKSSMIEVTPTIEILKLFNFIECMLILCPQTYGPWGVEKIHQLLLGDEFKKKSHDWPQGTPIMARSNQPDIGLANGDIGIIIGTGVNRRFLFNVFSEEQKIVTRLIRPSRLNMFEPAFAMTIHKAQGSEADQVILLWPKASKITKENKFKKLYSNDHEKRMIYTAITRAKKELLIFTNKKTDF